MALTDPIADMLTRIRNAAKAKFNSVEIPGSKIKIEIARVLKEAGFIRNYKFVEDDKQGILKLYLKYENNHSNVILGMNRVSKPSRRVYIGADDIKPVLNGMGISILSTSEGILTDKQAREKHIGGELLCNVW